MTTNRECWQEAHDRANTCLGEGNVDGAREAMEDVRFWEICIHRERAAIALLDAESAAQSAVKSNARRWADELVEAAKAIVALVEAAEAAEALAIEAGILTADQVRDGYTTPTAVQTWKCVHDEAKDAQWRVYQLVSEARVDVVPSGHT
jgi:hypothetical protein